MPAWALQGTQGEARLGCGFPVPARLGQHVKPEPLQLLCVCIFLVRGHQIGKAGPRLQTRVPLVHEKGRQTRGRHLHLWVGVPGKTEGKCLLCIPGDLRHDVH